MTPTALFRARPALGYANASWLFLLIGLAALAIADIAIIALDRLLVVRTEGDKNFDLEVGVGGVFQVMPILALVARARLIIPQFDPDLIAIPLQVDV